jgi:AbrB family looped-hinge helix DNA binding protein
MWVMMKFAQISTKGQIVIPADIRNEMGLASGMRVAIEQREDGIFLRPVTREFIRSLRGSTRGAGAVREREHRKER